MRNLSSRQRSGSQYGFLNPTRIAGSKGWYDTATSGSVYSDGAAQFTVGDKAYLNVASNSSLQVGDVDFEVGGWIYLDSVTGDKTIISKWVSSGNREYLLYVSSATLRFSSFTSTTSEVSVNWGSSLSASTWYFVRAWNDSANNLLCVQVNNGTAVTTAFNKNSSATSQDVMVGANSTSSGATNFFNGRIDSLYFTKTISSDAEATSLYNSGSGRIYSDLNASNGLSNFASNLISWWDLGEEDGIRYDSKGSNNLSQTFVNIIDTTSSLGTELITNGGFDSDTSGWTATNANLTSVAGGQSGNCLQIENSGAAAGSAKQNITTVANQNYTLSFYYKNGSTTPRFCLGSSDGASDIFPVTILNNANWTQYTLNFKATSTTTSLQFITNSTTAGHTVLIDTVTIKALTQTNLNGGFESQGAGETLGSELLSNTGFETSGTNAGTKAGTVTSTVARTSNVATIVTSTAHVLMPGNVVSVIGCTDTTYNASSVTVTDVIITDGGLETWTDANNLTNWTKFGAGMTLDREGTTKHGGSYSAKVTRSGANCGIVQDVTTTYGHDAAYWRGRTVTVGGWVNASVASRAYIYIDDGVGSTGSSAQSGSSTFEYLTVTRTIDASASYVKIYCYVLTGDTVAYFDDLIFSDSVTFTYANAGSDSGSTADTTGYITTDVFGSWGEQHGKAAFIEKSTASVHGGTYSCKLTSNDTNWYTPNVNQSVVTTASTRYKLTFWSAGDGTNAGEYAIYDDSNSAYIVDHTSTGNTTTSFVQKTVYFTTPVGCTSARVYLASGDTTAGYVYFDDVSVKQVTAYAPFLNWTVVEYGISRITSDTTTPNTGTYCMKMEYDSAGATSTLAYQDVQTVNHKYKMTCVAKASSGTPSIYMGGGSGGVAQAITTSYATYSANFTTSTARVYLQTLTASSTVYFDDVTLVCTEIPTSAGIASGLSKDGNLCANINGTSQYLYHADDALLSPESSNFSMWGWVNFSSNPNANQGIFGKWDNTGNKREYLLYKTSTGAFVFYISPDGIVTTNTVTSTVTPVVNTWYFVACWYDGSNIYISANNETPVSTVYSSGTTRKTAPFQIGRYDQSGTLMMTGRVDGVGFMKRALTSSERTALYNNGKGVKYAGLPSTITAESSLCFWNLDEYSAGTGAVTRLDSTSNDMDLTDANNSTSGQGVNYYEGSVSKWIDQSGNSKNLTQTTQSSRFLYIRNSQNRNPIIRGDGLTKNISNSTDLVGTGNATIVAVFKLASYGGSSGGRIIDNSKFLCWVDASGYLYTISDGSTSTSSAIGAISLSTYYVITITRTSAGVTNTYINGALSGTADQSGGTPAAGTPTYIGNNAAGNRGLDGDIGEIIIYDSILNSYQIDGITKYLKSKWGIS